MFLIKFKILLHFDLKLNTSEVLADCTNIPNNLKTEVISLMMLQNIFLLFTFYTFKNFLIIK